MHSSRQARPCHARRSCLVVEAALGATVAAVRAPRRTALPAAVYPPPPPAHPGSGWTGSSPGRTAHSPPSDTLN